MKPDAKKPMRKWVIVAVLMVLAVVMAKKEAIICARMMKKWAKDAVFAVLAVAVGINQRWAGQPVLS